MDASGAVMESPRLAGRLRAGPALSQHDRPTDRNAPSRRPPPGNQARFICNNPVTRRHYNGVLLLSSGTKATPPFRANDVSRQSVMKNSFFTARHGPLLSPHPRLMWKRGHVTDLWSKEILSCIR